MTGRPATPELKRGDVMIATSGNHQLRMSVHEVRVAGIGPKWITVIMSEFYDAYLANPADNRWRTRKFLRVDMREGEPGGRAGYGTSLVTPEQAAYDAEVAEARRFVRDRAGLEILPKSPYRDHAMLLGLAAVLRELLPAADDE